MTNPTTNTAALDVPLAVPLADWAAALEAVGIPVAGRGLLRVEADARCLRLTYKRRGPDGKPFAGYREGIAVETYDVQLQPAEPETPAGSDDHLPAVGHPPIETATSRVLPDGSWD